MSTTSGGAGGGPNRRRLIDALDGAIGKRPPKTVTGAESRFGWDAKKLAAQMGVSVRTAQRWRKAGKVPPKREQQLAGALAGEAKQRARDRIRTKGIGRIAVSGSYHVSNYPPQRANGGSFRALDGIPASESREIMDLLDAGDEEGAERALSDALGRHYGISGPVTWDDVDDMDLDIR